VYSNGATYVADQAEIGVKVTDVTGYTATGIAVNGTAIPAPMNNTANLFSTGTRNVYAWMAPKSPLRLTFDLGTEVENITGFTLTNAMTNNGSNQNMKVMDISFATGKMSDAATKINIVTALDLSTASTSKPKVMNIKFDAPITARYIYLDNMSNTNTSSYWALNEFRIFVQE
jgi:hypothetical protein